MSAAADRSAVTQGLTYRDAGVDVTAKADLLERLAPIIASTHAGNVVAGLGAFAGAIRLDGGTDRMLVATTDGVGTKTVLARQLDRDEVVGADIVAHCANDLVATGARPLAFLDYIAMGRITPAVVRAVLVGVAAACRQLGVALLGGETAEMPGVYEADAYDVVGTMIGVAPPGALITGQTVRPGHRLIGLASTGLHTNGYSLARRVLEAAGASLHERVPALGYTLGEALLQPHRCYAPAVLGLAARLPVHAVAHITGGGIPGNLVRVLPEDCRAHITGTWPEPAIFEWLRYHGRIPEAEMIGVFNLGIGMIVVVESADARLAVDHFEAAGVAAFEIGEVRAGPRGVDLD
ncbi:MAG: phosphoribosylformylglycinamidine cyclo-ligase [Armatimonadota bacterium]|nr:phosphoribosylformylglycinamidine cyclo-ligase [Armatimonadota bacterium]